MAKGQFNIKIDLPLIFWMIALLAAHKPLLLLDFHRSFNDTRTKGKSLWDLPFYFVNYHFLLHGNMQLLAVGRLYVEVLFYI